MAHLPLDKAVDVYECLNFIGGEFVPPTTGKYQDTFCPGTGKRSGRVPISGRKDVEIAVEKAEAALPAWQNMTMNARCMIIHKLASLYMKHEDLLTEMVMFENGKNRIEARGSVMKGNETAMYAAGMAGLAAGRVMEVSTGVKCEEVREPVGIVGSICPFNFPFMVPMWTTPIALALGNAVILKPSEKVPICTQYHALLMKEAGIPDGIFQVVNGMKDTVEAICDNPGINAVTFVGSTHVAQIVYDRATKNGKRANCMGGAKNHLLAFPDAKFEMAADDIVRSYAGTSGQRCMAASVLNIVGPNDQLLNFVVEYSHKLSAGQEAGQMGPMIDQAAVDRCKKYVDQAEKEGAKVLIDGRKWIGTRDGFWFGPTVLYFGTVEDPTKHDAYNDEIFGPILTVIRTPNKEKAMELQNASRYGNAAAVYTSSGEIAQWCTRRFTSGMIGVNIGVPVPREPFAFGGRKDSKIGLHDISGDGAMEFFTVRKKITTKWIPPPVRTWMD